MRCCARGRILINPKLEEYRRILAAESPTVAEDDLQASIASISLPSLALVKATEYEGRPWFFESIVPAGAFLITGRSKIGKSWFLMQLVLAASQCHEFMGFAALGKFDCLYIASEDDEARIKSRCDAFGVANFPDNVQVMTRKRLSELAKQYAPQMTLAQFLRAFLIQNPNIKIIILDTESTIRLAWGHETGAVQSEKSVTRKDYAEVSEMDAIAIELGRFIGLVNHTSKRKAMQWIDIHETINRTNTAMAGASGSFVISDPPDRDPLDSSSRLRVLGIRGRDLASEYLLAIEQPEGSVEFRCLGDYTAHANTQVEKEILDILVSLDESEGAPGQWFTAKDIAQEIGKNPATVQRAISRMMRKPGVVVDGRSVVTQRRNGIRLVPKGGY